MAAHGQPPGSAGRAVLWEATRPVSEWLVDRLAAQPGQTILELAAGAGETGFLAAARLGDQGRLISSDFAPQMVESATRVAAELGVTNAEFRVLDAERLELDDASVDGVICRFGYMLMAEPGRALRESRRVLRDAGRLVFSVFGEPQRNPWMTVARRVMVERGHLNDDVSLWAYTSELQGPIALAISKLEDEERHAVRAAIEEGYATFRKNGAYEFPGLVLNVLAS